jgi:3-hydroxybutyryl-CoA dehydrogenase
MEINRVGVVGCGTMGSGACEVCARAGLPVTFVETSEEMVRGGLRRIAHRVERAVERGKLEASDADALMGRISGSTAIEDLKECDFILEAVPEHPQLKREIFTQIDRVAGENAILATNTSSLSVIDMAVVTRRPHRVIGFHFFNPAQVMKLVELVRTVATDKTVIDAAAVFAQNLGKSPVTCRDRAGFIANLLLFPYLNSAVRMFEQGFASREDIDAAMKLGCGHPMGPLELLDLIGLDSAYEICEALWRQFRDTQDAPAPLIRQYLTAGYLGRKTGRGFYRYAAPESPDIVDGVPQDLEHAASGVSVVGIVGTGTMGSGIGEVAAKAGNEVILRGRSEASIKKSKAAVAKSVDRAVAKGKLDRSAADHVLGRITTTLELSDLAEADIVIEAVAENPAIKQEMFKELDASVKPAAILATTTSSLAIVDLAASTNRPDRVLGLHFFNPAPVMKLVEVIHTVATAEDVESRAMAWVSSLGKRPVRCRDRAGFIVNFLLFPYLNDAVRMHEEGYSTPQDIDTAMRLGCAHPMGPFELMDIVGLDVTYAILETLHSEFRERRYAPAPLLDHMVRAGYVGRKAGRGFYEYTS